MDAHARELAARQADVVARWQLLRLGWTARRVDHWVRANGWRALHPGVYVLTRAPLTRRQRWFGATLTAPGTFLSHGSAGACYGFFSFDPGYETVTRRGARGQTRSRGVRVHRSQLLDGEITRRDGIAITTAERTMIDIAGGGRSDHSVGRMFREALRLKTTTVRRMQLALDRYRGRRGTRVLRDLAARYADIPYERARSNAEARALELLHDSDVEPPLVNWYVAGEEADLVWLRQKQIVEIDGPQFHRFAEEDARKQGKWERAGFSVSRLPSDEVYTRPELLSALLNSRTSI